MYCSSVHVYILVLDMLLQNIVISLPFRTLCEALYNCSDPKSSSLRLYGHSSHRAASLLKYLSGGPLEAGGVV